MYVDPLNEPSVNKDMNSIVIRLKDFFIVASDVMQNMHVIGSWQPLSLLGNVRNESSLYNANKC